MKTIKVNDKDYEIVEDYKDAIEVALLKEYITDYFDNYDYILGDWSYGKLRLKGFCIKENKIYNNSNDYINIKLYIQKFCSYECKYFILKKISK